MFRFIAIKVILFLLFSFSLYADITYNATFYEFKYEHFYSNDFFIKSAVYGDGYFYIVVKDALIIKMNDFNSCD
ncbi:hypothetical protein OWM07_05660 [Deferribacter thermophilus]|uniref:hypothetical protein n=1 Tax=Deferribacter thermophilus TaxID=53573 RepID=UPI003C1B7376